LDLWFKSSEVLKISTQVGIFCQPVNAAKSAQNCPKLSKSAQKRNFEIPPKIEILVFFKNKNFYV
jgi:hypothetical protein